VITTVFRQLRDVVGLDDMKSLDREGLEHFFVEALDWLAAPTARDLSRGGNDHFVER